MNERQWKEDSVQINHKTIEDLIDIKEAVREKYPEAKDFYIDSAHHYNYDDIFSLAYLCFERLEVSVEVKDRIKAEEIRKKQREESDKRIYEKLKKKFGGEVK